MTGTAALRDSGALAVEMVIVIPALLLLVSLVFAYGRVAQVNGTMEAGVRDAARSASQARDSEEALDVARRVIETALGPGATDCLDDLDVQLLGGFQAGEPVTIAAECEYSMDDLGLPGVPGSVTTRSTFSSPLDPNRGIQEDL